MRWTQHALFAESKKKGRFLMKKTTRTVAVDVIVLICLISIGCATSFPAHRLPETGQLPPAYLSQTLNACYQFTAENLMSHSQQKAEREFVDVLKESGYFVTLSPCHDGDININAGMHEYRSEVAVAFVNITMVLSLATIPSWLTHNLKLTAKVASKETKEKEYVLDDSITTVVWLPLIVVTPFTIYHDVSIDVRKNMYRNLILKMQQDGFLPPPAKKGLQVTIDIEPGTLRPTGAAEQGNKF